MGLELQIQLRELHRLEVPPLRISVAPDPERVGDESAEGAGRATVVNASTGGHC